MSIRVMIGALGPLVARGLIQTLQDEHCEVLDATDAASAGRLVEAVVRLHPDAVIVPMSTHGDDLARLLQGTIPGLRVVECDDDRPRLRSHPPTGVAFTLEPVTATTLLQALGLPTEGLGRVH